jgi:hypothetical protein
VGLGRSELVLELVSFFSSMSSGVNVTSSLQLGLFSLEAPVGLVYCTFA